MEITPVAKVEGKTGFLSDAFCYSLLCGSVLARIFFFSFFLLKNCANRCVRDVKRKKICYSERSGMAAREKNFLDRYRSKNVNLPLHRMHILLIHFQEYPSVFKLLT